MQTTKDEGTREKERDVLQYLTFMVAGEEYAIGLLKVKEIIEYDTVTPVPKTPEWVRGVINLRGSVVPVIDLAVKFRLPASIASRLTCIVITEVECGGEATVMGVMADSVRQVIDLKPQEVEQPPTFGTRVKVEYLLGMARSGKKFCLILNTDEVLSMDELLDLSEAAKQPIPRIEALPESSTASAQGATEANPE
jgi:purine-binding chemotaxis protein CheW